MAAGLASPRFSGNPAPVSGPTRGRWARFAAGAVAIALLFGLSQRANAQATPPSASAPHSAAPSSHPAAGPGAHAPPVPVSSSEAVAPPLEPPLAPPPPSPPPPPPQLPPEPPKAARTTKAPPVVAEPVAAPATATSVKASPTPAAVEEAAPPTPAEVKSGEVVVFVIRGPLGGKTAEQRAAAATKALRDALSETSPDDVHVETKDGIAVVYAAAAPIVQLGEADAKLAGDATVVVHADGVAAAVRRTLRAEQKRSAVANTIFSVSLAVFFALLTLFLLRKVREVGNRADLWIEQNPERVPAIRVRTIEVLHPAAVRSALALAVGVARWVAQLGLVYAWLILALSLFEVTRGLTERLTGFFLVPLANFTTRFAMSLPIVAIVIIAGLALAILLRVVGIFFEGVSDGTTGLTWLPSDLARPTSALIRLGMIVLALVFVAPVITGDDEGALARAGLIAVIAIGLAATPVLSTAIVGAGVVFGRRIRVGEWTEVGSRVGRVIEVSLFETILEDEEANEVRVPHLALLWHPTRLHGAIPRVVVEVAVEPMLATPELRARLLDAAASVGADPRVDLVKLELAEARFALAATTDEADAGTQLLLRGAAEIAAARRAAKRSPP